MHAIPVVTSAATLVTLAANDPDATPLIQHRFGVPNSINIVSTPLTYTVKGSLLLSNNNSSNTSKNNNNNNHSDTNNNNNTNNHSNNNGNANITIKSNNSTTNNNNNNKINQSVHCTHWLSFMNKL